MIPVLPQARPWLMILQIMLSALVSISTATSTVNLATFIPLEDGTGSSSAFFAIPTSQSASPGDCIDSCFNNATGSGNQGGCGGISGQYECICAFPAMMRNFETCMSARCALDNGTIQQTLGNVQQICGSCTPDGCNAVSISTLRTSEATLTFQEPVSMPIFGLCYSTTQSAGSSSAGVGGFASVGPIPCGSSSAGIDATPSASNSSGLSDAASASATSSATSGASSFREAAGICGPAFFAAALGATLV
ncbi:hypothetical protein B0H14DRAFT_2834433 [Mycena olivaceomarginata]|nr:hypothetical protein B0H14DRAFT_2834433 [Mycena olivaceomarginata]